MVSSADAARERAARRRLWLDVVGIAVSIAAFAVVYGITARSTGLSVVEAVSMSALPFAGASQFAALGYLQEGLSWGLIVGLTALLNARHLLYSASLAPQLIGVPAPTRAAMAQVLTDEAFALGTNHFARLGRPDVAGYWIAAIVGVYLPWNVGTAIGATVGQLIPEPSLLGLDVVFPASMAGLAVGLMKVRRDVVAAAAAVGIGLVVALLLGTAVGVVAGGVLGPVAALILIRHDADDPGATAG